MSKRSNTGSPHSCRKGEFRPGLEPQRNWWLGASLPRPGGLRGSPTEFTNGRRGKRNAPIYGQAILGRPLHQAAFDFDRRRRFDRVTLRGVEVRIGCGPGACRKEKQRCRDRQHNALFEIHTPYFQRPTIFGHLLGQCPHTRARIGDRPFGGIKDC